MFGIGKNGKAWRQNSGKRKAIEGQHEGQGVSPGPVAIASVFGESSGRSLLIFFRDRRLGKSSYGQRLTQNRGILMLNVDRDC